MTELLSVDEAAKLIRVSVKYLIDTIVANGELTPISDGLNFKLLFPTFRNRYLFVRERLKKYAGAHSGASVYRGLNLGTGEGDYDRMIAGYCTELIGCDVNEEDLAHARRAEGIAEEDGVDDGAGAGKGCGRHGRPRYVDKHRTY